MTESKRSPKGRIFISYRRIDTSYAAGRIYDRLVAKFGEDAIFMDVDTIEGGTDFIKVLEDAVQSCDVLIALIGKQWLTIKDKGGKLRLNNPEDFVRIEIATALKRNIRVIPVLVDGVDMPQPNELPENLKALARRNALQVNHHSFNPDVYRLIEHTKSALNEAEESRVMKVQALQAAREKAEREVAEKLAQEKAWLEAEEQTRQKATKEEVERARREKEQVALEEKTRQKAEEKARLDAEGQEHKRVAREKAEQKATQEREKRDAAEKAKRERAERQVALITTLKETFSNFFIFLKSFLPKAIPFLRIAGFVGIGIGVLWIVLPVIPKPSPFFSGANPTTTVTFTSSPSISTKTPTISSTLTLPLTKTNTPTVTPTFTPIPTDSFLLQEDFEDNFANGWYFLHALDSVIKRDLEGNHYLSATGPVRSNYYWLTYGDKHLKWTDYAFESRIKFVEGPHNLAIWVRTDSVGTFSSFLLYGGTFNFNEMNVQDNVNKFYDPTQRIFDQGKWYTIRVQIKGNIISAYVDNVYLSEVELTNPLEQGGVGFGFDGGETLNFDDIRVWSLK